MPAGARDGESKLDRAVRTQEAKIAAVWIGLAEDLVQHGQQDEARKALDRAKALDPDAEELAVLGPAIDALAPGAEADDATTERIAKARGEAAKGYDKLAKTLGKEDDDPRLARALVAALTLEPTKTRVKRIADEAKKAPLLLTSPHHQGVAYVSLPSSWRPGGSYPVLVSVDGAGAGFLGNANAFKGGRGSRPFITVAPHAMSCTNEIDLAKFPAYDQAIVDRWNSNRTAFDVPGLLGILDVLVEHFGAEKQVAITGFSGGGNLCYSFVLRHPDRVFAAAPACANFQPGLAQGAVTPEGGGPPIHVMTGEKDPHRDLTHGTTPPGIEQQTDWAMEAFAQHGFTHVRRTMLPGVGHSNLVKEVWDFVDEVRDARR
jgi:hypothetical protein